MRSRLTIFTVWASACELLSPLVHGIFGSKKGLIKWPANTLIKPSSRWQFAVKLEGQKLWFLIEIRPGWLSFKISFFERQIFHIEKITYQFCDFLKIPACKRINRFGAKQELKLAFLCLVFSLPLIEFNSRIRRLILCKALVLKVVVFACSLVRGTSF